MAKGDNLNYNEPDPVAKRYFSMLAFTMVIGRRIRCSYCGQDYYVRYTEGVYMNLVECENHPDWYWLHALRFPDDSVIIWECCQDRIVEMVNDDLIPDELKMMSAKPYKTIVQDRLDQPTPTWLKKMHARFSFNDSGFSKKPHKSTRREDDEDDEDD